MMISIIIPARNRADDLQKILPSYLSQKHLLEVIIVDDSSEPEQLEKIRNLVKNNPKCVLLQEGRSFGLTGAKNRGIDRARGSFVFFGEDDMILPPDHLEVLLEHLKAHDADVIGGRKIYLEPNENPDASLKRTVTKKGDPFNRFLLEFHSDCTGEN